MTSRHSYTTDIEFGGDVPTACFEVTLSYTFDPGGPASGGSRFEPPTNPPDPASIDDLKVEKTDGKPRPWGWMNMSDDEVEDAIVNHVEGRLDDALIENAVGDLADDADRAAEARAESRREAWS